jgi:tetratricopeptide (TPR) repeat protein
MRIWNNKLLYFLALFAYSAVGTYAQNDTWLAIMTDGTQAQAYSAQEEFFPAKYISEKWDAKSYITDITYSPKGWRVVMGGTQYTFQRWRRQKTFPSDFIEQGWKDNLNITKIAYGGGDWVVVMSRNSGQTKEIWAKRQSFTEIAAYIKENWASRDIISMAYGNGEWVVVMADGVPYDKQLYKRGADFPTKWVQENYAKGYNITSATYGEGQWFVVLSILPKQRKEYYTTSETFPVQYIKDGWASNRRLLALHFNADRNKTEDFNEYYTLGVNALNADKYDEAIEHFTQALRLDPNNADAYNNIAWAKYLSNQCQGGLADINKSLALKKDAYAYHTKAAIELCLGRCHEALNDYTTALNMATKKEAFFYGDRGKAYACLGNNTAAIADFNQALKLDPSKTEYKTAKAEVENKMKTKSPPTITWDYPTAAFASSTKSNYDIKACIHSDGAPLTKVQVLLNGKDVTYSSRGFTVDEDCSGMVSQSVALANGTNTLEIVVTTAQHTTRSEKRTIEFKANTGGNYHALLIGVGDYKDMTIKSLVNPPNDIKQLRDVLTKNYTFNPGDIHMLADPTKDQIIDKLAYLQERLGEKDNLLIFYAGHGIVKNEVGYWLPADAAKETRSTWFSNAELRDYVNGMKSKHVLIVADACFSGSILSGSYRDVTDFACQQMGQIPSRRAMTSGANTVVPDDSVFFKYLIKRLQDNTAECFTAEDLYSKVKPAVINNSPNQQIPQFGVLPQAGDEGGNFIFKRK